MKATGGRPARQERVEFNLKDGRLSMFAKDLGWKDIIKIVVFLNLCVLPALCVTGFLLFALAKLVE